MLEEKNNKYIYTLLQMALTKEFNLKVVSHSDFVSAYLSTKA